MVLWGEIGLLMRLTAGELLNLNLNHRVVPHHLKPELHSRLLFPGYEDSNKAEISVSGRGMTQRP